MYLEDVLGLWSILAWGGDIAVPAVAVDAYALLVGAVLALSVSVLRMAPVHDFAREPGWIFGDLLLSGTHAFLLGTALWLMSCLDGATHDLAMYVFPLLGLAWCLTPIYLIELVPERVLDRRQAVAVATALQLWALTGCASHLALTTGGTMTCLVVLVLLVELGLVLPISTLRRATARLAFGPEGVPGFGLCCSGVFLPLLLFFSALVHGCDPDELTAGAWLAADWPRVDLVPTLELAGATAALAVAAVVRMLLHLPRTRRKSRVDERLAQGDIVGALDELAQHERGDFPAEWEPRLPPDENFDTNAEAAVSFLEACASGRVPEWAEDLLFPSVHGLGVQGLGATDALEDPVFGERTDRILELLHQRIEARDNRGAEDFVIRLRQRSGDRILASVLAERLAHSAASLDLHFEPPEIGRGPTISDRLHMEITPRDDDESPLLFVQVTRASDESEPEKTDEIPAAEFWICRHDESRNELKLQVRRAGQPLETVDATQAYESPVTPGLRVDLPQIAADLSARMEHRFPGWPLVRPRP